MRRIRTVVFPVPAPARTSIGPGTCSMATCCCGSAWMEELEALLGTAIEEENIRSARAVRCYRPVFGKIRVLSNARRYTHNVSSTIPRFTTIRAQRAVVLVFLLWCLLPVFGQTTNTSRSFSPGACGPADPAYIHTAEETGGIPMFLQRSEA